MNAPHLVYGDGEDLEGVEKLSQEGVRLRKCLKERVNGARLAG